MDLHENESPWGGKFGAGSFIAAILHTHDTDRLSIQTSLHSLQHPDIPVGAAIMKEKTLLRALLTE